MLNRNIRLYKINSWGAFVNNLHMKNEKENWIFWIIKSQTKMFCGHMIIYKKILSHMN